MSRVFLFSSMIIGIVLAGCAPEPFAVVFERGEEAARQGDLAAAASCFRKAGKANPDSMLAFYYLGQAELARENYGRAASAFQRAATLTTNDSVNAWEGLGRARLMQRRYDDANNAYERAIQIVGRTPRLLAARAGVDMRRGQNELAMTLLMEALQLNPDEPTALYNMAYIQSYYCNDKPAAVRYYQQFLKRAPETEIAARKKAEQALAEMEGIEPANSGRSEKSLMNSRQAATKVEAVMYAERAVNEDPLSADALWNLANCLVAEGRDSTRITRTYAKFAALFPDDPRRNRITTNFNAPSTSSGLAKARALAKDKKWKDAVQEFKKVLAVNGKDAEVWVELCVAAQKVPDWTTAENAAKKALELKKDHPAATYHLGVVLIERGQKRQGGEYVRKYLKTLPDNHPNKKAIETWLQRKGA